jgi:gas vesicle protein
VVNNKGIKIVAGVFGVLTGVVGGILLARRSSRESREELVTKIRSIYGIYNEEFRDEYTKVKDAIERKILSTKNSEGETDQEKYNDLVDEILKGFKNDHTMKNENAEKLEKYFKKN